MNKNLYSLIFLAGLMLFGLPASAKIWKVDADKSTLEFSVNMNGSEAKGHFKSFTSSIDFDPENSENSAITVEIDISSASMGDPQLTMSLKDGDWFATKKFPKATFTSTSTTPLGDGEYDLLGNLTIKDKTKPVKLHFKLIIEDNKAHASGQLTLLRSDFALGLGQFPDGGSINLDVKVFFSIWASPEE